MSLSNALTNRPGTPCLLSASCTRPEISYLIKALLLFLAGTGDQLAVVNSQVIPHEPVGESIVIKSIAVDISPERQQLLVDFLERLAIVNSDHVIAAASRDDVLGVG